ncbi:thiamine-phosphate kinase [Planctomycetota bacterium]|nr:thiamine-phosphate kinase [Planctomycetota bacterium]
MQEFELLANIFKTNSSLPSSVSIPPGDDMGAIRLGNEEILITVDQVADGVHFLLEQTDLKRIARKAVTRNLSDVAAMGAAPLGAVCAINFPKTFTSTDAETLLTQIREVGQSFNCPIIGGDISAWPGKLIITITIFANMPQTHGSPILRSTALEGDGIYVTGPLGGSLIDHNNHIHHLDFEPRLDIARHLAEEQGSHRPHAMIDLSDGLARDAAHIATLSNLTLQIQTGKLPISQAAQIAAQSSSNPPWQHAISDGEDYELLFTADPEAWGTATTEYHGLTITHLGTVAPKQQSPIMLTLPDDDTMNPTDLYGWEHTT